MKSLQTILKFMLNEHVLIIHGLLLATFTGSSFVKAHLYSFARHEKQFSRDHVARV